MSLYAIKLVWCNDPTIIEGDTKPDYDIRWETRHLYRQKEAATARANFLEQLHSKNPSFVAALVCELIEKT